MKSLKPCPFCSSTEFELSQIYRIYCAKCRAAGPISYNGARAKLWNTRKPKVKNQK